jgi:DNA (cytosine-5)-methyltransferase 1
MGTVTAQDKHGLAAVHLTQMRGTSPEHIAASGHAADQPVGTITSGGNHHALVAAFLTSYYSSGGTAQSPGLPLHTITTIARHGLVTVDIDGETYAIADIGLRMLEPHELAAAMGFPTWYRWQHADGRSLSKRDAVKMIGNACPVGTVKALIKAVVLQRPTAFGLEAAA